MAKLAIDIALLPPEEVMDLAIELNRQLTDGNILNKTDHLPHISLCIVGINKEDLFAIEKGIVEIAKKFEPIAFVSEDISTLILSDGKKGVAQLFKRNAQVQELHEAVVNFIKSHSVGAVSSDAMHPELQYRESSVAHVGKFIKEDAFENYDPHLTLGIGDIKTEKVIGPFTAKRLAICHLGNFCTCRKILFETELKGE